MVLVRTKLEMNEKESSPRDGVPPPASLPSRSNLRLLACRKQCFPVRRGITLVRWLLRRTTAYHHLVAGMLLLGLMRDALFTMYLCYFALWPAKTIVIVIVNGMHERQPVAFPCFLQ
jgi:hypothetical protein